MEAHPIAELFPLIETDELHELAASIEQNGLIDPIVIYEGKILDGRNRYRACAIAGVEPVFKEYENDDPVGYVLSLNLYRRHLNAAQRASAAADMANMKVGRPPKPNSANVPSAEPERISLSKAAEIMNISRRSVATAQKLKKQAIPEVVERLDKGEISVNLADKISKWPEEIQKKIAAMPTATIKQKLNEIERISAKVSWFDASIDELLTHLDTTAIRNIHAGLESINYADLSTLAKFDRHSETEIIRLCDVFTKIGEHFRNSSGKFAQLGVVKNA